VITFPSAVRDALRSVQCSLLADNAYIVGSVGRFAGPVRDRALDGLNATRRLIGCDPTDDPPGPQPVLNGGQCAGVEYTLGGRRINDDGTVNSSWNLPCGNFRFGPITPRVFDDAGTVRSGYDYSTSQGQRLFAEVWTGSALLDGNARVTFDTVARCDGQPDNCGTSPPVFTSPISITRNIDVTYNIENGDEVTINIPFVFAPITVDFNGNFRIPVTFDFGGNEFSASFPLDLDASIEINFPGLNPGDGQDVDDLPPDEPGETVPPVEPDQKIIGVVVNVTSFDNRKVSEYSSPGIPRILVPRVGSVRFAYSLGGATFWSPDIDVKGDREFIPCPFSQGADAVVASPQVGVNLSFVPIRGFPLATAADARGTA
jgi:hypothetical protein